nr:MAG TPA: hypothetical protein [Caudoviricetes sp.]
MAQVVIPGFRKIETSSEGTDDYNSLSNIPFINNVLVKGNLKTEDLKLTDTTLTKEGVPAESKTVGTKLDEKIDKKSFNDAGIKSVEYEEMFGGEFTVTTVKTDDFISPHATASVTGRAPKEYQYRVTVNGAQYILDSNIGIAVDKNNKPAGEYEYLGDLSLFQSDISGIIFENADVPFLITFTLSSTDAIEVFTKTESTLTIKVEKILSEVDIIPAYVIKQGNFNLIRQLTTLGSVQDSISIGVNDIKNTRCSFVFGDQNFTNGQQSYAVGLGNRVTHNASFAFGALCQSSGAGSLALGNQTTSSGTSSTSTGTGTTASGTGATATGIITTASGGASFTSGQLTEATASMSQANNANTKATARASSAFGNHTEAAQPAQFVCGYGNDPQSDSIFEVGNGLKADGTPINTKNEEPTTKQNAFRVTQDGRAVAQTGVQIGETNITEDQLKKLLALLSN